MPKYKQFLRSAKYIMVGLSAVIGTVISVALVAALVYGIVWCVWWFFMWGPSWVRWATLTIVMWSIAVWYGGSLLHDLGKGILESPAYREWKYEREQKKNPNTQEEC